MHIPWAVVVHWAAAALAAWVVLTLILWGFNELLDRR